MVKGLCFVWGGNENVKGNNEDILFLPWKAQNYMFLQQLYQQEIIKNYQNFWAKDLEDYFIGINIKQKVIKN